MLQKLVANRWAALIIGAIALVAGIVMLSQTDVTCGRKVMKEGDVCATTKRGSTINRTYSEQRQDDALKGYLATGVGVVFLIAGGAGMVMARQRRTV